MYLPALLDIILISTFCTPLSRAMSLSGTFRITSSAKAKHTCIVVPHSIVETDINGLQQSNRESYPVELPVLTVCSLGGARVRLIRRRQG